MGINDLISEGKELRKISDRQELQNRYKLWCGKVRICMKEIGVSEKEQDIVSVKMHYVDNEYSENDTMIALKKSLEDTIQTLNERMIISEKEMDKQGELLIERILEHFYKYYQAMYKDPVNKRGTLTLDALNTIQIGNEYDLQRMLYAVLLPVFPTIRQEVYNDNGYGGMRADIYLDLYNLIIETKCTRESMSVKQLIEELGADGFHYRADVIYFFIWDKNRIIKNPEAFKKAFARERKKDGKTVKVFILQTKEF